MSALTPSSVYALILNHPLLHSYHAGKGSLTIGSIIDEFTSGIGQSVDLQVVRLGPAGYALSSASLTPTEAAEVA